MLENGLGLEKYTKLIGEGLHGNHPAYDRYIISRLDGFISATPHLSAKQANNFLQKDLIPEMKTHIMNAKNSIYNLNSYFKEIINPKLGIE